MVLNLSEKGNGGWRSAKPQPTRDSQLLLNFRQFLRGELSGFGSRVFFLDLLVDALGFERLVGTLVEFGQLQLGSDLADGGGRLADQFLIESGGFFHAVGLAIERGGGRLGDGGDFAVASGNHFFEIALGGGVVTQGGRGDSQKIMGHVSGASVGILVNDGLKLFLRSLGAVLGRSEGREVWLFRRAGGTQWRVHGANCLG